MTIPIRPYWPTLANMINRMCKFITKHQSILIAVLIAVDPSVEADVLAAFAAINAACTLFIQVQQHVDPNWKPS